MDLFSAQLSGADASGSQHSSAPLAVRMRPRTLDEVVGQDHLLSFGAPLRKLFDSAEKAESPAFSVILYGPAGTGKTSFSYLLAKTAGWNFIEISAVSAGVTQLREAISAAKRELSLSGKPTVLFIDEVHRFSKAQQDALLPAVENKWVTLVAATTENPVFSVISPLLSRSLLLVLQPLSDTELKLVITRALKSSRGLNGTKELSEAALGALIRQAGGDARKALSLLEATALASKNRVLDVADLEKISGQAAVRYGIDQHYDVASAFIKSMRGSDPDATVFYLAKMLVAGEDPRFIARRIVIAAAEEVGLAAPTVLTLANTAFAAVSNIGMPEARIILAEAALAVATAPKSNAAYLAIDEAIADVKAGLGTTQPRYLCDPRNPESETEHYLYAHDFPSGVAPQQYLPDDIADRRYYRPSTRGAEERITAALEKVRLLREPK